MISNGKQNKNSYSIDRLDPLEGYMKDNILVVSWRWNRMKTNRPLNYYDEVLFIYET